MLIAQFGERRRRALPFGCRPVVLLVGTLVTFGMGCGSGAARASPGVKRPTAIPSSPPQGSTEESPAPVDARSGVRSRAQILEAERSIAVEAKLPELLRIALARNPELAEARERLRAAREGDPAGSRLPDPEFEYQLWAQPLSKPYALDEAQMHMFGVRQAFPAPGSLGARGDAALAQARVAFEAHRTREQDIALRVRRGFDEYYRADRQYRVHLEHARLAQQVTDLARAAYQGGRGSQQDVLRAAFEVSRLHHDLAGIERDRRTARALLNTLMARPPDAPLGPPGAIAPPAAERGYVELESVLPMRRPEVAAAHSAVRARASELDATRASARWPSFMVGLQYMYMPPESDRHDYGVMFSMSLPWFNSAHSEAVRAAEANLAAEKSALMTTTYAARYELYEAVERLRAARESFTIIERDLLPLAQQSFESAEAAYRGGQADLTGTFDALRSLLDVRLEREQALVLVDAALADMERAAGGPVTDSQSMEHE
jgi:cobalt-zinc-cadmium efflux system outer membrane protein